MAHKLRLLFPMDVSAKFARTSIRRDDYSLVDRVPAGGIEVELELEPGIYAAQTDLPDGTQLQAAFEIKHGSDTTNLLLRPDPGGRSIAFEQAERLPDDPVVSSRDMDGVDQRMAAAMVSLVTLDANGSVMSRREIAKGNDLALEVVKEQSGQFLEIRRDGEPDLLLAAPSGPGEPVEFTFHSRAGSSVFTIAPQDEIVRLLLRYMQDRRIGPLSDIVGDHWPKIAAVLDLGADRFDEFSDLIANRLPLIEQILAFGNTHGKRLIDYAAYLQPHLQVVLGKGHIGEIVTAVSSFRPQIDAVLAARRAKPAVSTLGGYALLLVGPPTEHIEGQATYVDLLAVFAPFLFDGEDKSADELCIRGEVLARQGKHDEALELFLELSSYPPPAFTYGLSFALNRLTAYRNALMGGKLTRARLPTIEAMLQSLMTLGAGVDFSRPLLVYTGPAPRRCSNPDDLQANRSQTPLNRRNFMPGSADDQAMPKSSIDPSQIAKEFDDSSGMDDSSAYLETGSENDAQALEDTTSWRPAKSLLKLQAAVNQAFPNRKKGSDGMIGDPNHCPGTSDHCANIVDNGVGIVTAFDITHDPAGGCDMRAVTDTIVASRDVRIKYIIYDHQICSSYAHAGEPAWTWRPYSGSNPHTKHGHFSVAGEKAKYDDTSDWQVA